MPGGRRTTASRRRVPRPSQGNVIGVLSDATIKRKTLESVSCGALHWCNRGESDGVKVESRVGSNDPCGLSLLCGNRTPPRLGPVSSPPSVSRRLGLTLANGRKQCRTCQLLQQKRQRIVLSARSINFKKCSFGLEWFSVAWMQKKPSG